MQQIAMSWLVYQMTGSSFLLGAVLFLGQIPFLFFPPFFGVLLDHRDRRSVLYITQSIAMLQALILAVLSLTGAITVWEIMGLSLVLGIVMAFDMPARQAFLSEMVEDRDDLTNAVAMNATMFNGAQLIGPALAGIALAYTSAGFCFFLNAFSFLAVLWSLAAMRLKPQIKRHAVQNIQAGLREDLAYLWSFVPLRNILLLLCFSAMSGGAAYALLPEYTTQVLGGDAQILGWLGAARGLGALVSALFLATRQNVLGLGKWIVGGSGILGAGIFLLPFTSRFVFGFAAFFMIGFGLVVHLASSSMIIQTVAPDDKRGSLMGYYTMAIVGVAPLGSLLAGALSSKWGLGTALLAMGSVSLMSSAVFLFYLPAFRKQIRAVYTRLKIIPATIPSPQAAE